MFTVKKKNQKTQIKKREKEDQNLPNFTTLG